MSNISLAQLQQPFKANSRSVVAAESTDVGFYSHSVLQNATRIFDDRQPGGEKPRTFLKLIT